MTLPTWATEKARGLVREHFAPQAILKPIAVALIEAERRGAERMRERAMKVAQTHAAEMLVELPESTYTTGGKHVAMSIAYDIGALPLEESGS